MSTQTDYSELAYSLLGRRPIAIDLFSGVGGLSLGLEQAGFHVAIDVEIEEITGRYAQYNAPATSVLYGDIDGDVRNFGRDTLKTTIRYDSEIALIAGGPPCQGFSLAGKKTADDPLNFLVGEFGRVVLEILPLAFLMENVPGITISDSTELASTVKLLKGDYDVIGPLSLLACDFGVPQARERVFILGFRKDLKIRPTLPTPTHLRPKSVQGTLGFMPITPTVDEAISDLPEVDQYPELIDGDRVPYEHEPLSEYQRIMRDRYREEDDLSLHYKWNEAICTNVRRTQHGEQLINRFRQLGFGKSDKMSGIRRLDPHDVSTTIRAGTTKERGAWSAPRPLHSYQDRVLTTRECARMQSFPDWFFFHPTKWHGNRQVGNAVPPLLAKAIGKHILEQLQLEPGGIPTNSASRDESMIAADIEGAAQSGLSRRRISQVVTHPRKWLVDTSR